MIYSRDPVKTRKKADKIMDVLEVINTKFGRRTLRLAAEGFNKT